MSKGAIRPDLVMTRVLYKTDNEDETLHGIWNISSSWSVYLVCSKTPRKISAERMDQSVAGDGTMLLPPSVHSRPERSFGDLSVMLH